MVFLGEPKVIASKREPPLQGRKTISYQYRDYGISLVEAIERGLDVLPQNAIMKNIERDVENIQDE